MKLEFYPEVCCDYCNEVIHNHFDCPSCGENYAATSVYGNFFELLENIGDDFYCGECSARFVLENKNDHLWDCDEWEWKMFPKVN